MAEAVVVEAKEAEVVGAAAEAVVVEAKEAEVGAGAEAEAVVVLGRPRLLRPLTSHA